METDYTEYVTQSDLLDKQIGSFFRGMVVGIFGGGIVVTLLTLSTCLNT
jgi:hypothetical protein